MRYVQGRRIVTYAALAAVAALACTLVWPLSPDSKVALIPVAFLSGRHIRWTALWELLPVLLAASAPPLWAPNLPHIEHQGRRRLEPYAAAAGLLIVVISAAIPYLTELTLPDGARVAAISSNVTLIAGLSLIFAALLGSTLGPLLTIAAYLALVVVQHSSPEIAVHLPFGTIPENPGPHWFWSLPVAAAGIALWSYTLGQRLLGRDPME